MRDDGAEQTKSGVADKENERPENKHEFPKSNNKLQESAHDKMLPMTRTTAADASIGPTTCPDLVAMLEAPKAPSSSPTLEGETTLETFLLMQRR
jgi:hypothetical protein